jgi:8-oxo-dGTP diphosphatase
VPTERRFVVAAVIESDRRVLVARRPADRHLGGLWEFPGGAVEDGESPIDALVRELHEELGIVAEVTHPITFGWHRDAGREVVIFFYGARIVSGEPHGREGQDVRWVTARELGELEVPPADADLVDLLRRKER